MCARELQESSRRDRHCKQPLQSYGMQNVLVEGFVFRCQPVLRQAWLEQGLE